VIQRYKAPPKSAERWPANIQSAYQYQNYIKVLIHPQQIAFTNQLHSIYSAILLFTSKVKVFKLEPKRHKMNEKGATILMLIRFILYLKIILYI